MCEKPYFLIDEAHPLITLENCKYTLELLGSLDIERGLSGPAGSSVEMLINYVGNTVMYAHDQLQKELNDKQSRIDKFEELKRDPEALKQLLEKALKQQAEQNRVAEIRNRVIKEHSEILEQQTA